ncbi:MAG: hypothetical protein ACYCT2_08015 [Thermoplasmataceae archaeon]
MKKIGEEAWKRENDYGKRWLVEIYLARIKRVMGEIVKVTKPDNIVQEIAMKVVYYNELRWMTYAYYS